MQADFKDILLSLRVPKGAVLYVHSSFNYLRKLGFSSIEILHTLLDIVGEKGTLLMPSFPFDVKVVAKCLEEDPVFDVCRTPTVTGLIPELFRRLDGVVRSLHPWASVAAYGCDAEHFISDHHRHMNPFGPSSPFERIVERDGILLGLGVSLNTNSFIHFVDNKLKEELPFPIYESRIFEGEVKDREGCLGRVSTLVISEPIPRGICPSLLFAGVPSSSAWARILRVGEVQFFAIWLVSFVNYGMALAKSFLSRGTVPVWHSWYESSKQSVS